ncbi:hypothetical protein V1264_003775 [Littorina saxatilis]|uniref:histone acetyltransferase n=1 Tax=Littorina saxatilis TaxID=31220 RepID=A0AAN9B025_9CAEN
MSPLEDLRQGLTMQNNDYQDAAERRRQSIQRCIQSLVHACQCKDPDCHLHPCQKMKKVVRHTRGCRRKTNGGCPVCKNLIALCCYHAKRCNENGCGVPFCRQLKVKLEQQRLRRARVRRQEAGARWNITEGG